MIIKCIRCGKDIDTANNSNADYIMAEDTIVKEPREVFIALKHNQSTREKEIKMTELDEEDSPKYPDLEIADSEYDQEEVPSIEVAQAIGEELVKIVVEVGEKDIQKTGIICSDCYRDSDFV
ncbi:unnamed protein product, partial [marine sediment metagenome]